MKVIRILLSLYVPACHVIFSLFTSSLNVKAEESHEYFKCKAISSITSATFTPINSNEERIVIEWTKVVKNIERSRNLCADFVATINSNINDKNFGYMIPGYDVNKNPVYCMSKVTKYKDAQETICDKKNILLLLRPGTKPSKSIENFYNAAFTQMRNSPPVGQGNNNALLKHKGEYFIDMNKAINGSK
jgi:Circadian oscillating protein COP23